MRVWDEGEINRFDSDGLQLQVSNVPVSYSCKELKQK